jgi:hypothetical protein
MTIKPEIKSALAPKGLSDGDMEFVSNAVAFTVLDLEARHASLTAQIEQLSAQRDAVAAEKAVKQTVVDKIVQTQAPAVQAPPTLGEAKKAKLALLADYRWQNVTRSAVPFEGRQYASDERSQAAYVQAAFLAGQLKDQTFAWKLKNGEHVMLDARKMITLATMVGAKVQRCFNTESEIAAKIMAATTLAELDAIDLIFTPIPVI